ncbi:MAG: hypothetical protein ACXAEU_22295 [Candidatus Hodarchaeales archaeon]
MSTDQPEITNEEFPSVTIGKMVSLDSKHDIPIEFPSEFVDAMSTKHGTSTAVMIFSPSSKNIRVFSTKSDKCYKVVIEIGKLSSDFLQELSVVFMRRKIEMIYSTGLCFTPETCIYEGFIDYSDIPEGVPIGELKADLERINGVINVETNLMEL